MLEVTERRQAGAEIVEREAAAEFFQRLDEAVGLREARDRRGLGDLEADLRSVDAALLELLDDERQELVVAQALAGKIDGAHGELLALVGLRHQPAQRILDDPAIDGRRQAVALGGGDEVVGRHHASRFIAHAQQQFVVRAGLGALQRLDRHAIQLEAALFQRRVDARGPLHLAPAAHELDVVLGEAVHAVAAAFLGRGAGAVGGRDDRRHVLVVGSDRHHADRRAETEHAIFPGEAEIPDGLAQHLGGAQRFIQRAGLEKNSKLVTTEAGESISPAHLALEQRADLAQQHVAGRVAAGVVDDLELVDVEITQRVAALARLGALQRSFDAALEFAAVDEARQQIVRRVIREAAIQLTRLRSRHGTRARRRTPRPRRRGSGPRCSPRTARCRRGGSAASGARS